MMVEYEAAMKDLEDASKTCVYIPPRQKRQKDPEQVAPDGEEYELRMRAYRTAWNKCLTQIQGILRALQRPVVDEVAARISGAYDDVLPGLPYPELPVVALHDSNSSLVADIARRLEDPRDPDSACGPREGGILQVHLYPADCSSVMNMMKAIVTGFVDQSSKSTRKSSMSLANFDINLLRAWYTSQPSRPNLAIFLHEFEKFDAAVLQDVFYICSMHVPQLPLTFVLLMASPASPSFLHSAYPRSTLALLRVYPIVASSGLAVVKDVLVKTFFDPNFEPDVMLGPSMLEFITDFAMRHTASPDALVTLLQLAYMKHFNHPLTVFVHDELLGKTAPRVAERDLTSSSALRPLVDALQVRLLATSGPEEGSRAGSATPTSPRKRHKATHDDQWEAATAHDLLQSVAAARSAFRKHARSMRVAFAVARIAEEVALGKQPTTGARNAEGSASRLDSLETLSGVLRGRAGTRVRYVCMAVKKLHLSKLRELLHRLHAFLWDLQSAEVKREEEGARVWIVTTLNQLPPDNGEPDLPVDELAAAQDPAVTQLAGTVGEWLHAYIEERLVRLDEQPLWDIWYTGNAPFPSELVNPAPRPTVVAALLHPHDVARAHADIAQAPTTAASREPALWELPDTSIAFRRYVEAGRMVNAYDWFESFAVVLETQRRKLRRRARGDGGAGAARYGRRADGRGRSNDAGMDVDGVPEVMGLDAHGSGDEEGEEEDEEMSEEEEERWKAEVQARFLRAVHELDYMGFVKHTGRKPDHVIRTIYDIPD